MAKLTSIKRSFNAGELDERMDSRSDQQKYAAGCKTMENFIPQIYGGAERRTGLERIAAAKSSTAADKSNLIEFEHSVDDTYVSEFYNQGIRFFKDGARVFKGVATQDLSAHTSNITAQWNLDDNLATNVVVDGDGATHNGTLYDGTNTVDNTQDASDTDGADEVNRSFDMDNLSGNKGMVEVADSGDFSFGDGTDDSPFTLHAWVKLTNTGGRQDIITKWRETDKEWELFTDSSNKVVFRLNDDSGEVVQSISTNDAIVAGEWTFIVATYTGTGGATATSGMKIYVNWVLANITAISNSGYVAMENLASAVSIGGLNGRFQILTDLNDKNDLIGNMTDGGPSRLANAFDGNNDQANGASAFISAPGVNGPAFVGKDWGPGRERVITGFKAWGSNDQGFVLTDNPTVTIELQGSQNNTDWTDLGNGSVTDTTAQNPGALVSVLSGLTITTAYRYHRLKITHDSGNDRQMYCAEVQFFTSGGGTWTGKLDIMAVLDVALSAAEIAALTSSSTTTILEIATPYLTADLFDLKFENSADVMFISHPAYEERRLSRLSDTSWTLEVAALKTGPFRDQNTDTAKTISASATTGSVTLTATGHSPFVIGSVNGHEPSGSEATSKSQTGALFKLIHASNTPSISGFLVTNDATDNSTAELTVPKGITWDITTNGTWGTAADSATIQLQREYGNSGVWESVLTVTSAANRNIVTDGTEDFADAQYRVSVTEAGGDASEVDIQLSIRDTSHIGIVQITSVTSTTVAVGTVVQALGATDSTHRWSEGSFSNRRGWPIDVTISSEERLTFTGNVSEPLTIWGSFIGDFTDFALGVDDDSAIQFTLVGSGQQNRIRWTVAKDAMILGTNGGEHLLGASKNEEALTPTNVKAKLQTTYGSEDVAAQIVNQAVLFLQRGGKKIREFLYNFQADAHKADDLTVFAGQVTGDGIVDMAFQRTPDPILWCVRTDGQLAIMNYERDQNVFSWARMFTTDSTANSVIESVAVIYGGARSEDEVWISVLRQINSLDSRSIERFAVRELPSSPSNWKFLDSYITATPAGTTVSGLDHLEGETVQVLGDGVVQTETTAGDFIVGGGAKATGVITVPLGLTTVQVGLGYTSTIVPMDIDLEGLGLAVTTRINRTFVNVHDTVGGKIGPDTSHLEDIVIGTTLTTGFKKVSIPGGYKRDTDITIQQTQPLPMTVLGLTHDIGGSKD